MQASDNVVLRPGDTIGILPRNSSKDVQFVLDSLNLKESADCNCTIRLKANSKKKLPIYLPTSTSTIRTILSECVDFHGVPKKLLLRSMMQYTSDVREKQFLDILASKEASELYSAKVVEKRLTFLDILRIIPTCKLPIEVLMEQLPRLLPRSYSIANYNYAESGEIKILFSTSIPRGLTTSWLQNLTRLPTSDSPNIPLYVRKSNTFILTNEDIYRPTILIATGTGIAPFLGFLELRNDMLAKGKSVAECWLFYGCRYKARNYLYCNLMQEYCRSGTITRISESFSRDKDSQFKYVQDQIISNRNLLSTMLCNSETKIFVCGGSKMTKSVENSIEAVLKESAEATSEKSFTLIQEYKKSGRYLEDIWL